jgi:putative polyketide hydroxylase
VLNGWAGPGLLDSYETERRPVAEHNVSRSADLAGTTREAGEELQADLGGRLTHVWVRDGASTHDLLGPGLTLFTGPDADTASWERTVDGFRARAPVAVRQLSAITAGALGIRSGGALPVRPDGTRLASLAAAGDVAPHTAGEERRAA